MKTKVKERLAVSQKTRGFVECIASLNDNYKQTVNALNACFGSNEKSTKMLLQNYYPAYESLMTVLEGFLCESVISKIDSKEVTEI